MFPVSSAGNFTVHALYIMYRAFSGLAATTVEMELYSLSLWTIDVISNKWPSLNVTYILPPGRLLLVVPSVETVLDSRGSLF